MENGGIFLILADFQSAINFRMVAFADTDIDGPESPTFFGSFRLGVLNI